MNILIIGKFYTEGFALHISETLKTMGHNPVHFHVGVMQNNLGGKFSKRINHARNILYENLEPIRRSGLKKLSNILIINKVDLTIVCHDFLTPEAADLIKLKTGSPLVLWFPDAISNFHKSMFLVGSYDALFFKDPYIVYTLRKDYDKKIYYLPECCNPASLRISELSPEDINKYGCDITTAGNLYASRAAFFKQLDGYNIKLWGNPAPLWMNDNSIKKMVQNQFVANEQKVKAFRAAKIVLNNLHPAEIWGVNARAFEVAASGAFQLINYRMGLNQLFDDGKELISFKDIIDLREKIDYYLAKDNLRKNIAEAGQKRALLEHTYEKRLKLLIDIIFNNKESLPLPRTINSEVLNK